MMGMSARLSRYYYRAEVMKICSILGLFVKSRHLREFLWEIFVIGSFGQVQNVICMDFLSAINE